MLRRVGARASAGRAAVGEDLGPFRAPREGYGTARQSASGLPLSLTVGRSQLHAERSGSESRRGSQESAGPTVLEAPKAPDRNSGIWPLSRDRFYIALPGHPFNSGIWPHEYPVSRQAD